ncbi:MAG: restriction endonuclease subunit S, partial [Euryarchaeota archaeon]|nr:restriction endonuclease subunit S [Euryarchaeota archaeon]
SAKDVANCESRYIEKTEKRITQKGVENSAAKILPKDTIVITSRGTVGKICLLPYPMSFNQTCYGLVVKKGINPLYLFYKLKSMRSQIDSLSYGTVFDTITKKTFDELKFSLPSENEQRAIASILGAFDDKIALNRQMNCTLEAIGQALFKHWFVELEFPNEEGKPYRSSGGEMVDSELGEVPAGWRVGTLKDICEISMGQSPPGETYNETGDGLPFYQGISDFGFRFPSRRVYCTSPTRFAEDGDVLLSVRAPIGSLNVAEERCAIGRGVAALRLKGKQSGYLYYLLRATQSGWNKFEAEGTVFGSVTKSDVHDFKVILLPETLYSWFGSLVEPLDKQIATNEKQSRTSAALRNALLPKLMSGEIRVKVE